jgi:hypothetical protein
MAGEVIADLRLESAVVRDLDPEPDGDALRRPPLARVPDGAFAIGKRDVVVGRCGGVEVDVIRDRELGDATVDCLAGVVVDRDDAVRGEARVEVAIEREVLGLAREGIGHRRPRRQGPAERTRISPR